MGALDADVLRLAGSQHGFLTTRQASAVGLGPYALQRLVTARLLVHPARGLYAVAHLVDRSPDGWHRHLGAGAHLLYEDAVLTGVSAVLAHGLPVWGADLRRPRLHRPVDRAVGAKAFHVRPCPVTPGRPSPVDTPWGRADEPATALVQLAMDDGVTPGVVSTDAALAMGLVTDEALAEAVGRVATWPRASRARSMLTLVDARSESVGESRCRVELATHGIRLVPQHEVRSPSGRLVARADFLVEGTNVLVEFDGKVKYAAGPEALWAEKKREDRLRALGYVVVRLTWADLETPGRAVAKVRRALRASA